MHDFMEKHKHCRKSKSDVSGEQVEISRISISDRYTYMCVCISMVSGTDHSSLDRHFFQNDDQYDKTHRAQNVYHSRPT